MTLASTLLISALIGPNQAAAIFSQPGFPAKCAIEKTCEGDICVKIHYPKTFMPMAVFLFWENEEVFMASTLEGHRVRVGFFKNLPEARTFVNSNAAPYINAAVLPDLNSADAFRLNMHRIWSSEGTIFVSYDAIKLSCSKIGGGL